VRANAARSGKLAMETFLTEFIQGSGTATGLRIDETCRLLMRTADPDV
jgi:hypothetical protein